MGQDVGRTTFSRRDRQQFRAKVQQCLDVLAVMLREVFSVCATHRDELTILHYDWHILSSLDELTVITVAECPFCGSRNTALENPFGPTLCRAIYHCADCRQPFEQFKRI